MGKQSRRALAEALTGIQQGLVSGMKLREMLDERATKEGLRKSLDEIDAREQGTVKDEVNRKAEFDTGVAAENARATGLNFVEKSTADKLNAPAAPAPVSMPPGPTPVSMPTGPTPPPLLARPQGQPTQPAELSIPGVDAPVLAAQANQSPQIEQMKARQQATGFKPERTETREFKDPLFEYKNLSDQAKAYMKAGDVQTARLLMAEAKVAEAEVARKMSMEMLGALTKQGNPMPIYSVVAEDTFGQPVSDMRGVGNDVEFTMRDGSKQVMSRDQALRQFQMTVRDPIMSAAITSRIEEAIGLEREKRTRANQIEDRTFNRKAQIEDREDRQNFEWAGMIYGENREDARAAAKIVAETRRAEAAAQKEQLQLDRQRLAEIKFYGQEAGLDIDGYDVAASALTKNPNLSSTEAVRAAAAVIGGKATLAPLPGGQLRVGDTNVIVGRAGNVLAKRSGGDSDAFKEALDSYAEAVAPTYMNAVKANQGYYKDFSTVKKDLGSHFSAEQFGVGADYVRTRMELTLAELYGDAKKGSKPAPKAGGLGLEYLNSPRTAPTSPVISAPNMPSLPKAGAMSMGSGGLNLGAPMIQRRVAPTE